MDEKAEEFDWNKVITNSTKAGFRDGMAEGQQANYQDNFDKGYQEGFKNGFLLGKLKANLRSDHPDILELGHTKRGNCVICKDKKLLQTSLDQTELIQLQNEDTNKLVDLIHSKYKNVK